MTKIVHLNVLSPGGRVGRDVSTSLSVEPPGKLLAVGRAEHPSSKSVIWKERQMFDTSVKHPLQTLTAFCCQEGWVWRIFFTFFSIAFILLFMSLKLVQFMHSVRKKDMFPHYSRHTRCFFAICLSLFSPPRLVCFIPVSFFHPGTVGSISHRAGQAKIHKNNAHQTRPENLLWIPP